MNPLCVPRVSDNIASLKDTLFVFSATRLRQFVRLKSSMDEGHDDPGSRLVATIIANDNGTVRKR